MMKEGFVVVFFIVLILYLFSVNCEEFVSRAMVDSQEWPLVS